MSHDQLPRRLKPPISNRRLILLIIALFVAIYRFHLAPSRSKESPTADTDSPTPATFPAVTADSDDGCHDRPGCLAGVVTHIVDGDTLDVDLNGTSRRVRLVLVDAPERDERFGPTATKQLSALCQPGTPAFVWPDTRQPKDEYGRTLALVFCGGRNVNEAMIRSRNVKLYRRFCSASAFGQQAWARELGCRP